MFRSHFHNKKFKFKCRFYTQSELLPEARKPQVSSTRKSQSSSHLNDYRRLYERRKFSPRDTNDPSFVIHPRERLGLDYDLNAVLNIEHRLTPTGDAFRNLYFRNLLMHARGRLDSQKALHFKTHQADKIKVTFVPPTLNPKLYLANDVPKMNPEKFSKLGALVSDFIGDDENLFVLDASVGSHRLGEHLVRVISDSPNLTLYLNHILPPQPKTDPYLFQYNLTVYLASKLTLENPEEFQLSNSAFIVYHAERCILLIGGIDHSQSILEAIQMAVASRMMNEEFSSLALPTHILAHENRSALVMDPCQLLVNFTQRSSLIQGYHGALWNNYGIYRMYQGMTHINMKIPRKRGDLVESVLLEDGETVSTTLITQPLDYSADEFPQPSAFIFIIRDITGILPGVSKLSPSVASKYLAAGYQGNPNSLIRHYNKHPLMAKEEHIENLFQKLLIQHETSIYLCNVKRRDGTELTQAEIQILLKAAIKQELDQCPMIYDETLQCQIIQQIQGIESSLDPLQGWDPCDYASKAKKLASVLEL